MSDDLSSIQYIKKQDFSSDINQQDCVGFFCCVHRVSPALNALTVELLWHVQNYDLIWLQESKLDKEFSKYFSQKPMSLNPFLCWRIRKHNKANLRDLIAVTVLLILLKSDPNRFFCSCENFTDDQKKTLGNLFHPPWSYVCHFIAIHEFKMELQSRNTQFGSKWNFFSPLWPWNLMDDLEKQ